MPYGIVEGPMLPLSTVYRPPVSPSAGRPTGAGAAGPAENRALWTHCLESYARRAAHPDAGPLPYVGCTHEPLREAGTLWWNCMCLEWTRTEYWTPQYGRRRNDEVPSEVTRCTHQPLPQYAHCNWVIRRRCACFWWTRSRHWRVAVRADDHRDPAIRAAMRHTRYGNGCVASHRRY
jgi:hypothetical protein